MTFAPIFFPNCVVIIPVFPEARKVTHLDINDNGSLIPLKELELCISANDDSIIQILKNHSYACIFTEDNIDDNNSIISFRLERRDSESQIRKNGTELAHNISDLPIRIGAQLLFLHISLAIVIREILFLEHTGQVWILLFLVSCTADLKTVALQKQNLQIANSQLPTDELLCNAECIFQAKDMMCFYIVAIIHIDIIDLNSITPIVILLSLP